MSILHSYLFLQFLLHCSGYPLLSLCKPIYGVQQTTNRSMKYVKQHFSESATFRNYVIIYKSINKLSLFHVAISNQGCTCYHWFNHQCGQSIHHVVGASFHPIQMSISSQCEIQYRIFTCHRQLYLFDAKFQRSYTFIGLVIRVPMYAPSPETLSLNVTASISSMLLIGLPNTKRFIHLTGCCHIRLNIFSYTW